MNEARRIVVVAVALLLSGCGVTIYPAQLEVARSLCDAHGGVRFLEITTSIDYAFIEAFCADGVSIKARAGDSK